MNARKLMAGVAASLLIATPALANQAAPLSIAKASNVKAVTSAKKSNTLDAGVGIGIAIAIAIGVTLALTTGSDSN